MNTTQIALNRRTPETQRELTFTRRAVDPDKADEHEVATGKKYLSQRRNHYSAGAAWDKEGQMLKQWLISQGKAEEGFQFASKADQDQARLEFQQYFREKHPEITWASGVDGICGPRTWRQLQMETERGAEMLGAKEFHAVLEAARGYGRTAPDLGRLSGSFSSALEQSSRQLGVPPEWVATLGYLESGLNERAVNSDTKAAGMFQLHPRYGAREAGVTFRQIMESSPVEQLAQFRNMIANRIQHEGGGETPRSFGDLYMLHWLPKHYRSSDDTIVGRRGDGGVYDMNSGLDYNRDGVLTVQDVKLSAEKKLRMHGTHIMAQLHASPAQGGTLYAGDSITEGYTAIGVPRQNVSAAQGRSVHEMVASLGERLRAQNPETVVFGGGTNDLDNPDQVKLALKQARGVVADYERESGRKVRFYCTTLPPYEGGKNTRARSRAVEEINQFIRSDLALGGSEVIDFHRVLSSDGKFRPELSGGDGVHPNQAGYRKLYQEVVQALSGRSRQFA